MAKSCHLLFLSLVLYLLLCSAMPAPHSNLNPVDLAALHDIRNTLTDIPSSVSSPFFSTWDFTSPDPCSSFSGLTCSFSYPSRRVTSLILGTGLSNSPGLAGTLSPSISNLTELTQLVLYAGIVTGSIPPQIGFLKNLRVISLTNNRLTGTIPSSIFSLPNLHTLDLSRNQLSGSLPPSLLQLTQLKVLVLAGNRISGPLPNLPDGLLHLDLNNNEISSWLPRRMPATLRYFSTSVNRLWGPINCLESLSELVYLDLSVNRFSGPIPGSLFRPTLSSMLLQRNNLTGRVPPGPPLAYEAGSMVDLSHNFLTGELTPLLSNVETLFLNNNRLTGTVPAEYLESVNSGKIATLYLQHNYLTGFPSATGNPLPESVSVCLSYNCMVPPLRLMACPASAGDQLSRPAYQCSAFHD